MRFQFDRPFLAGILILMALFLPLTIRATKAQEPVSPVPGVLRLHVIANSDSDADQAVKLRVRDALLTVMKSGESVTAAKAFLLNNGSLLQKTAESVLKNNGFSYGVQLMLGIYPFPDRTYGDLGYPAGDYEALRVILGDGAGQNWWCVLFPPLCILSEDADQEEAPASGDEEIAFESSIVSWWRNLS